MKLLITYWSVDETALVLVFLLIAYALSTGRLFKTLLFPIVCLLFVLCFFSPLHLLAIHYLFSAHMVVHVVLLLIAGPLLLRFMSPEEKRLDVLFSFLKQHPVVAWLTGIGTMWFWHIPVLFNAVMSAAHQDGFSLVPLIEAVSLLVAGMLFSAPVLHPNKAYRIEALPGVVYLFTACVGCSLIGLLITFAPPGTYHHFLARHDVYGLNAVILNKWGLTPLVDQQAAGLVMWVPCCLIYVAGALYLLVHWFNQKETIGHLKETG